MTKKILAEMLGTFVLVFIGTGAAIINDTSGGAVSRLGVALAFGLAVTAMIFAIGNVSGAHINPCVTLAFFALRRIPAKQALAYVIFQSLGAISASLLLGVLFPGHPSLGATLPAGPVVQSLILEMVLTLILMFVVLSLASGSKESGVLAGLAVGAVVCLEAYIGGPISGASMNPARSLGPALVTFRLEFLWIYLLGPVIGALAAIPLCRKVCDAKCCVPGVVLRGRA